MPIYFKFFTVICFRKILISVLFVLMFVASYASPKVSIILPVYNSEVFLAECLNSILSQSFTDFELICINDGSTDNSESILKEYARNDARMKIITQKNSGAATARNVGLESATGKYISFVDSDDTVHRDMLSILTDSIEKYDCDLVMCNFGYNEIDGNREKDIDLKQIIISFKYPEKPFDTCIYQVCWNKLYRKSSLAGIKFKDGMELSEDAYFNFLVFAKIKKYAYVPVALYNYRDNPASVTAKTKGFSRKNVDDFVFAIRDICEQTTPSRIAKEDLKRNVINYLAVYLWASTSSMRESLYAAKKISEMYNDGIIDMNINFFDGKYHLIFSIIIGKVVGLF